MVSASVGSYRDDVQKREKCGTSRFVQRRVVAVGACVDGFERRPADFAKESTRQEVALPCHTACFFWI